MINLQRSLSLQQSVAIILPVILILDFIVDNEFDYVIVIIELLIHTHISHLISANTLYNCTIASIYFLNSYTSILGLINFSSIDIIYNIVVNIICIISIFHFTDHRKLTSRFSTIHFDTLFHQHKEVYKAFINIP